MATSGRILGALALFITVLGAVAQTPPCQIWVRYRDVCAPGGSLEFRATSDPQCQAACNNYGGRCKGYMWDSNVPPDNACYLFFDQVDIINSRRCTDVTTNVNNCLTTYPFPTTTPITTFPPFRTTKSPCPPVEGLGEGLVALACVFSAVGGAILGMMLAYCLCPRKGSIGRKPSSDCPKKVMPSHFAMPSVEPGREIHSHVAMPAPGREIKSHVAMPSIEPGRVYSVPKTSTEPYTLNISVR